MALISSNDDKWIWDDGESDPLKQLVQIPCPYCHEPVGVLQGRIVDHRAKTGRRFMCFGNVYEVVSECEGSLAEIQFVHSVRST